MNATLDPASSFNERIRLRAGRLRSRRRIIGLVFVVVAIGLLAFLVPPLASVPASLSRGCGGWLTVAGAFELLSALGFVAIFTLTFCRKKAWRRASWVGFGALGATTLLPAGGLLGPAAGALSVRPSGAPVSLPASRATAFALLTNAPNVISLAMLGLALWIGLLPGPHSVVATLVPGAAALGLVALGFSLAIRRAPAQSSAGVFRGRGFRGAIATLVLGAAHARELLKSKNWRLLGAPAYYLFDTAVLWATFEAFGHSPPLSIIGMAT